MVSLLTQGGPRSTEVEHPDLEDASDWIPAATAPHR
jgi:hypothetical protein